MRRPARFFLAGLLAFSPSARAETIDATRLVVLTTTDRTSMGGAGIAYATGANGLFFHPAAPALRDPGQTAPFSFSFAFGNLKLGVGHPSDVGNTGSTEGWTGGMSNLGLSAGIRHAGLGVVASSLTYSQGDRTITTTEAHATAAGAVWGDHVVFGGGYRLLALKVVSGQTTTELWGSGIETGLVLADLWGGFNTGSTFRSGVTARDAGGSEEGAARVPWQVTSGIGWRSFRSPVASRFPATTLVVDLVVDGVVADGYALEPLLDGRVVPRGRATTVSPHVGAQVEVMSNRLRLRAGSYLEPSRTELSGDRLHGTGGFELRLIKVKALKGFIDFDLKWEAGLDAAPRYLNLAWLGIGFWQPLPPAIVAPLDETPLDGTPPPGDSSPQE